MSETKPLPWKAVNTPITWQIRDDDNKVVVESWGYGSLPDADASLIVASVNARSKVEELVNACHDVAQLWPHLAHHLRGEQAQIESGRSIRRFEQALREVEAALKVSP